MAHDDDIPENPDELAEFVEEVEDDDILLYANQQARLEDMPTGIWSGDDFDDSEPEEG